MPTALLEHLNFEFKSGETLALELGVSRAAVHKAIHALEGSGIPLEHSRAGYRLKPGTPAKHLLEPQLKGRFGREYSYLGSVDSTQNALRVKAEAGELEGAVVLSETQTGGRGRRGRPWQSPPGVGLYFSLLLRPHLALERLPLISLAAGVALAEVCVPGQLKWPNDLLAPDGRKLAGILLEGDIRGEELRYVLLGIGLNVHATNALKGWSATLDEFQPVHRLKLLSDLLEALERWVYAPPERILHAWKACSCTLGREVKLPNLTEAGELGSPRVGIARDLDSSGALLVEVNGVLERISAGDVELVGVL